MQRKNNLLPFFTFTILQVLLIFACSKKSLNQNSGKEINNNKSDLPSLPIFIQSFSEKDTLVEGLDILFSFKKTACFGFCPTFDFNLYSNGVACYEGIQFTKIKGKLFGLFSETNWNEIKTKASLINFSKFEERYPIDKKEEIPDLPLIITGINYTGTYKVVENSHSAPAELKEFEMFIQGIIDEFIEKNSIRKD